ncbi:MAG TPA: 50S ribosomal protein L11 methyltransferase [Lachnospiraceae bacterium]|nr:50S ribosomal protein L11 methyltransferase [uncultured Lachnoclostridium sp.]HAU85366.1 50S ribosomal protein L11 methyltransferase [Lachnospiraceae bacterium]
MKWRKVSLATTTEAVDLISCLFDELGFEGIQIEDHVPLSEEEKKSMYIDIVPDLGVDDGKAVVSSYVDMERSVEEMEQSIQSGLDELAMFTNLGERKLTFDVTDDEDWINNWKAYFKPFRVTDDIVIKPTWETLEEVKEGDIVVDIDPGTAFGTGSHETTKLVIQGMEEYLQEDTELLDIGCGSGILSIIGLKLGAKHAVGTDIDPIAVEVAKENATVNQIEEGKFDVYEGNLIDDEALQKEVGLGAYDVVVANILADVIIPLSAHVSKFMKKDGIFISSGIIDIKKDEVEAALLENGFEIVKITRMGDWFSFQAKCK